MRRPGPAREQEDGLRGGGEEAGSKLDKARELKVSVIDEDAMEKLVKA